MKQLGILKLTAIFLVLLIMAIGYMWASATNNIITHGTNNADAFTFGLPFGGEITDVDVSTCCGAVIITVDNLNPTWEGEQELLYYYGSPLFENYNFMSTGNNVVGDAIPIGLCLEIDSNYPCTSIATYDGIMTLLGTE